ncbi:hypothetical protein [Phenylobacterium sp.]|uniref:hypothetical protein n=1 Tax=Phenylobacterium sp. TaxID=1871053 RepID=UPI0027377475|nr:hypothetical protein [Phenylobacterium sp.]MDP3853642.1 hypothetical protein [Phenylobacterium sp.]
MPDPVALAAHSPLQRIKFDRWMFDHGLDNIACAELLGAHPMSVGRWRKPYDDPARRIPHADMIHKITLISAGQVQPEDWYRACGVRYVPVSPSEAPAALGVGRP